ncbi:MAG TPA: hypothetical protein VHK88_05810 [Aquihabitans sp.]|nr:hypothetical protein [Aquihabitans sp.]
MAAGQRPIHAAGLAQRTVHGRIVAWGDGEPPVVLGPAVQAAWPFLDGTATVAELADDLAGAAGMPGRDALALLTMGVLDLATAGLVTGVEPLLERWEDRPGRPRVLSRTERIVDGVRQMVTELAVQRRDLDRATGDQTSLGEAAGPTSCTGRRLQLDRPAEVVTVAVRGRPLCVRTDDPELARWLAPVADDSLGSGPVAAFVTRDPRPGTGHRYAVYDGNTFLVGDGTDVAAAQAAVVACLVSHHPPADRPGLAVRAQAVERDGRLVLGPRDVLRRPRGLHRQLRRSGVRPVAPSLLIVDGVEPVVAVPRARTLADLDELVLDRFDLRGFWLQGDAALRADPARTLAALLRGLPADPGQDRQALLDRIADLVSTTPCLVTSEPRPRLTDLASTVAAHLGAPSR